MSDFIEFPQKGGQSIFIRAGDIVLIEGSDDGALVYTTDKGEFFVAQPAIDAMKALNDSGYI